MDEDHGSARWTDGNAAAGPLHDLFGADVTLAQTTCATCGSSAPLAEQRLYTAAPAAVLRCNGCEAVLLRWSSERGHLRVDLSGTRLLVLPLQDTGA